MTRRDPEPMAALIQRLLSRMGMRDLGSWQQIVDGWDQVVDEPWRSHARPLALANGKLIVEADSPAAIGLLRYGIAGLINSIDRRYGDGTVTEVEIRRPAR